MSDLERPLEALQSSSVMLQMGNKDLKGRPWTLTRS